MNTKIVFRILGTLTLLFALVLVTGFIKRSLDSFTDYRPREVKPLVAAAKELKYYSNEEKLIRNRLSFDIPRREKSILTGLHWLITQADDEKNFEFFFPDFLLLMNVLATTEYKHQEIIAKNIVKTSLKRIFDNLGNYKEKQESSRWIFLGMLYILDDHREFHDPLLSWYKSHFGTERAKAFSNPQGSFKHAIATNNYKLIFDYLVQASYFNNYVVKRGARALELAPDSFPALMQEFEKFEYVNHDVRSRQFRDLAYLVTHVPLILTGYGRLPLEESVTSKKAFSFIETSLDDVHQHVGDFDLFAEYVQCLKILKPAGDSRIDMLEKEIFDLQRSDGSWGRPLDFSTNPYTLIHPTGAALMALNQGRREKPVSP